MGQQGFRGASGPPPCPRPLVRTRYRGLLAAPRVTSHPGPIGHFPDRPGRLPPPPAREGEGCPGLGRRAPAVLTPLPASCPPGLGSDSAPCAMPRERKER